jgi:hypothetical protein
MKNILSILLITAQAMFLTNCAGAKPSQTQSTAQSIWNGTADTAWHNASQTKFTITTPEQLTGLAKLVNGGNNFEGKTVKLQTNIILNDTANWQNWANEPPANKWTPIGNWDSKFNGIFDGNGFAVSGVYIDESDDLQGFFGFSQGIIKNLGVTASYIKGKDIVGGLSGTNERGIISNCYSTAWVTGEKSLVGGLVGTNNGSISNSYSLGKVTGIAESKFIGGLAGRNLGLISNSYSAALVTGNSDYVGGLAGQSGDNQFRDGKLFRGVINSYYDKEASKQSDSGKDIGKTEKEMKEKMTFSDWDFNTIWGINSSTNNGYPYLLLFNANSSK